MLLCLSITLVFLCAAGTRAWAMEEENAAYEPARAGELSVWKDGVSVETVSRGNVTEALLTAPESAREYFYPYFYRYGEYDLTDFGAYTYRIHNIGSTALRISFALTNLAGTDYRIGDYDSVVAVRNGDSVAERIFPAFGLFELEPGFEGEVYIPLDRIPKASLQSVVSYGVTVAVPCGEFVNFEISEVKWTSGLSNIPRFRLSGPDELQIPAMGDAVARYTVDFGEDNADHDVVFTLEDETENISITEDGIITVKDGANAAPVEVSVSVDGLVKSAASLTLLDKRPDFAFQRPSADMRIADEDDPFLKDKVLNGFRIICAVIAIYPAGLYLLWKTAEQGSGE